MVELLSNYTTKRHCARLNEWLRESEDVFIAVAFLKFTGLDRVLPDLEKLLQRGDRLTMIIGTDFWLTEPRALWALWKLKRKGHLFELRMFEPSVGSTYHPKYYRFHKGDETVAVVGSANLTKGGLDTNVELSIVHQSPRSSGISGQFAMIEERILSEQRCYEPIFTDLQIYETEFAAARLAFKQAGQNAKRAVAEITPLTDLVLRKLLNRYRKSSQQIADLKKRKGAYRTASRLIQTELVSGKPITRAAFRTHYGRLVGTAGETKLWHSGSVFRSKKQVVRHHQLMQKMIREISENLNATPEAMFGIGRRWIAKIPGLGPNVFTEFCNTLSPSRFAVLNNNPITSLQKLGQAALPSPQQFSPENYQRYCDVLQQLRHKAGFRDLGETDHFLNFVYWTTRKQQTPQ